MRSRGTTSGTVSTPEEGQETRRARVAQGAGERHRGVTLVMSDSLFPSQGEGCAQCPHSASATPRAGAAPVGWW